MTFGTRLYESFRIPVTTLRRKTEWYVERYLSPFEWPFGKGLLYNFVLPPLTDTCKRYSFSTVYSFPLRSCYLTSSLRWKRKFLGGYGRWTFKILTRSVVPFLQISRFDIITWRSLLYTYTSRLSYLTIGRVRLLYFILYEL